MTKNVPDIYSTTKDIDDPMEVLELLKKAILRQSVDKESVAQALRQVLNKYEAQNRVFLIAAANAELPRILKLLSFINTCENVLFSDELMSTASVGQLIKLYALSQSNLVSSLDNVKKVADMRIEILKATGVRPDELFDAEGSELNALSGLPGLDSSGRDRIRKLITGLVEAIDSDESVVECESEDSDSEGVDCIDEYSINDTEDKE